MMSIQVKKIKLKLLILTAMVSLQLTGLWQTVLLRVSESIICSLIKVTTIPYKCVHVDLPSFVKHVTKARKPG